MGLRILVTGATRGLGRAMTEGFAQHAHTVVGCGRDAGVVAALQKQCGATHRFDVVDVADNAQVARWAVAVGASSEPFDILVNNAAVMNDTKPLWEILAAEMQRLVDVNIVGTANVIRHFLPPMVARRRGVVVNFSSGWGRSTAPEVAPYCATKYAVEGLTLALAQELPKGMAAIPLNPGIIDTDMLRRSFGEAAGEYESATAWAERAVPFLLKLGPKQNGKALTVA